MAYTTIDDPSAHFQTITYSGNGASRSITNTGNSDLKPDWVWIKERNNAVSHRIFDSSRGATKRIFSNNADAESTQSNSLTAFNTDGFSLGDGGSVNGGSDTYVAWQWKANGGTTSSNTSGSVTSTVQANTTAGISIVTWTAANGAYTIGHGLGTTPAMVITKDRDTSERNWWTWHQAFGDPASAGGYVALNKNDAKATAVNSIWGTQGLSSTLFGFDASTSQNDAHVGYFFAEIKGYSKFGSYTGNGSTDGTFVYTGFRPAFVMIKRTDNTSSWSMRDTSRSPSNVVLNRVWADLNNAESTSTTETIDILSNGFKARNDIAGINTSGGTYIYMAFAEHPFVSSEGAPVTAR